MKQAGILCPVFSLKSAYGIGDFGPGATEFLDILRESAVEIWQVLPLNPLSFGHSPYQPLSSFAGETLFISLEGLYADGLIRNLPKAWGIPAPRVDYEMSKIFKTPYFKEAFKTFSERPEKPADYEAFLKESWVIPYGIFTALKEKNQDAPWMMWSEADKAVKTIEELPEDLRARACLEIFLQYEFRVQWDRIREAAKARGIRIMGDIPFYVGGDSLDVFSARDRFFLDSLGYPTKVAGVPPDYFSETGQRWGNPIYDWEKMEEDGFAFWTERLLGTAKLYDMVRIDHFLAFHAYWEIPAESETAINGEWVPAPGLKLFAKVLPLLPGTEIVAEDLGLVSEKVYEMRDKFGFPGMNVLQFTMQNPEFKVQDRMVTYTGTHDNTTAGAYMASLSEEDSAFIADLFREAGIDTDAEPKSWQLIQYAMQVPTDYVIVPVQDVLDLDEKSRMNVPGTVGALNWTWKLTSYEAFRERMKDFRELVIAGKGKEK